MTWWNLMIRHSAKRFFFYLIQACNLYNVYIYNLHTAHTKSYAIRFFLAYIKVISNKRIALKINEHIFFKTKIRAIFNWDHFLILNGFISNGTKSLCIIFILLFSSHMRMFQSRENASNAWGVYGHSLESFFSTINVA